MSAEHEHSCSCHGSSCSSKKENKFKKYIRLGTAILLVAAGVIVNMAVSFAYAELLFGILCGLAALVVGFEIFTEGFKSIIKLKINETTLMSIAVIAAFCLGEFLEGTLVTLLFFTGEIFEELAVASSRREISKLSSIRPDVATVIINGEEVLKKAEEVNVGDTILVKPYERIALDGTIIKGCTMLDTSAITGESVLREAEQGAEVLSGMLNTESEIYVKVQKLFGESTAARILKLTESAAALKSNQEKLINRFAAVYTPLMLLLAVIIFVVPPLIGWGSWQTWLLRSLVCLVASCPCSIVISVPLAYFAGIGAASKQGVLIKGGRYLEALNKADAAAFDKTGTITKGCQTLAAVDVFNGYTKDEVLSLAAAAEKNSTHPLALSIKEAAPQENLPILTDYSEKPSVGVFANYGGKKIACIGKRGLADFGISYSGNGAVFVIAEGKLAGALEFEDEHREEAPLVLAQLNALGVKKQIMLTGDSTVTAEKIAEKVGITEVFSELLPEGKVEQIQKLKAQNHTVIFVGDGINDSPSLTAADCGVALGFGTDAAIESADVVLSSGDLTRLPDAKKLAKKTVNTVKANIAFSLVAKAVVMVLAVAGLIPLWPAVVADTGMSLLCVLNSVRILRKN
ncbi:MAG: cadmium-translocating P-type ATPase [Oscillospiraceae bacterium]|jgi:Cd2+/Zn2+-exporting ATPase|nr:cadmium-translocating P-type ATPase [Oscillospiraceae bacterium]